MKPIGIIGGGLGGLAAACVLAARGRQSPSSSATTGSAARPRSSSGDGFRFDMGPTILTIPSVLRRIFAEAGRALEDYLDLVRLDPQWRCFFDDGSVLDLAQDPDAMAQTLDAFAPGTELRRRLSRLHRLQRAARPHLGAPLLLQADRRHCATCSTGKASFDPKMLGDVLAMRMGRTRRGHGARRSRPTRAWRRCSTTSRSTSARRPTARPPCSAASRTCRPTKASGIPCGGTRAVPDSAGETRARTRRRVPHRHGDREDPRRDGGEVTGVRTDDGEEIALERRRVELRLRPHAPRTDRTARPARRFERRRSYEPACSGVVLYLGLNKRYEHLAHHDFVFSRDPHEEFDCIYKKGEPAPDPTCYLAATTCTEPGTAPPGGEALYVLVHTPYLRPHHDWKKMLPEYRRVILDKLKRTGGMPDIEERIVFERALTPQDIHDRYHVLNGAIYGLASHGKFLGAFKPGNRSPDLRGLYLAGGAAHPGPGMPMVLMSGWIAADTLDRDTAATERRANCEIGRMKTATRGKRPRTAARLSGRDEGLRRLQPPLRAPAFSRASAF